MPGSSDKMIGKALASASDQVMVDLEDAVAPREKAAARRTTVEALRNSETSSTPRQVRSVRINDVATGWALDDLLALFDHDTPREDSVILPKAEAVGHVHWLDHTLTMLERRIGITEQTAIELQIEGPAGLSIVAELIQASTRVASVSFGPWDFLAAMQMPLPWETRVLGPERCDTFLATIAVACRRFGVQAMDGPHPTIDDADGVAVAAGRAADLGFDGKWAIHPAQLEPINRVFTPTETAWLAAHRVIDAYDEAIASGDGAVALDGVLVDEASRRLAHATVERGRAAGLTRPTD